MIRVAIVNSAGVENFTLPQFIEHLSQKIERGEMDADELRITEQLLSRARMLHTATLVQH